MNQPDFSGYLKKSGGKVKTVHRRYFELHGKQLLYFKSQGNKEPAGSISLEGATLEEKPKKLQLDVATHGKSDRVYNLQAENEADYNNWAKELQAAIAYKPQNDGKGLKTMQDDLREDIKHSSAAFGSDSKVSLGHFELLSVIGRGGFGKVLKVRKLDTKEIYAMKVLRKDVLVDENMISHTLAEKQILQDMDHPFIVRLHYAFQTDQKLYLVLDFLSGGELYFHLKNEVKFGVERARFYIAELILAIEHLHNHDIVFRDLKPENIMLTSEGHICLTDFGLAKGNVHVEKQTYTFCGSTEYLAPEVIKGTGHGKGVDWWSLGILLYELLVGLPPFYSENVNEIYDLILRAPVKFPSTVPEQAQSLIKQLLERDPNARLGAGCGAVEIKTHPFFNSVDWMALAKKQVTPPFIPNITDDDLKYFDSEFTNERMNDTIAHVVKDEGVNFDNFDFDGRK
jgi:serine/threonine protein kinase